MDRFYSIINNDIMENSMNEPKLIDKANVKSISHILITDPDTKQVIVNKRDVHPTHQKRKTMHDDGGIKVVGHLLITDMDTGEVLAEGDDNDS